VPTTVRSREQQSQHQRKRDSCVDTQHDLPFRLRGGAARESPDASRPPCPRFQVIARSWRPENSRGSVSAPPAFARGLARHASQHREARYLLGRSVADVETVSAWPEAARAAVVPLHEHLQIVDVPDSADPPDSRPQLLHFITMVRKAQTCTWHLCSPLPSVEEESRNRSSLASTPTSPSRRLNAD
jgi:hypothetical protein